MVKTCTLVISGEIYHFKFTLDFLLYFFAYCRRYYSNSNNFMYTVHAGMSLKMVNVSLWHNVMLLFSYKPHRKSALLEATYSDRHLNTRYMLRESQTTRNVLWSRASVCLSVCLSAAACLQYCTDPDVTWRSGRGCPLVVLYWADLQSMYVLRCYGNTMEMRGRAQR